MTVFEGLYYFNNIGEISGGRGHEEAGERKFQSLCNYIIKVLKNKIKLPACFNYIIPRIPVTRNRNSRNRNRTEAVLLCEPGSEDLACLLPKKSSSWIAIFIHDWEGWVSHNSDG